MSWLSIHKRRLDVEGGSIRGENEKQRVHYINHTFKDSPTYLKVLINEVEYDTRIITDKKYNMGSDVETKKLLFLPYEKVTMGDIAEIKDEKWLIVFFNKEDLKPKANIRFCNEILRFDNGNEYPCVIDNKLSGSQTVDIYNSINLPAGSLKVTVTYNEDTKNIKELDRFVLNGNAFEVQAFDKVRNVYKGVGIMDVIVKKVPLKETEKEMEPETPVEIPVTDYFIEIDGINEVEINRTETYIGKVYLNGDLTTEGVIWSIIGEGEINSDGLFTAPSKIGLTKVVAKFSYLNSSGILETKSAKKEISIIDNDDWGWG